MQGIMMPAAPTLLIIDDSRVSRMMIKQLVASKHPDWNILEAADGEAGLQLCAENDIDYFSIDLNMPGIDGLKVIEQLQQNNSTRSMVLMTANIQEAIFKRALQLGASCIHKPITEESIGRMLEIFNG
jgi:CheY-like chemotaxis protein